MSFNPQISFKSAQICNTVSTNLLDKYKNTPPVPQTEEKDTVVLNKDFIADLKYNKEKAALGTVIEGYVNGRKAAFKAVSNNEKESWLEGVINKKYLLMHCREKAYSGKYGDEEFNLTIDYNEPSKFSKIFNQAIRGKTFMPDYFHIKGNLGNKEIDITLPNVKIPADKDVQDLLTLVLEDNGLKAQTINGEVKSLKFAASAVKNIKQKAENREKMIDNNIKPIIMQGISTATGMVIGSVVSALLFKFGLKR